MSNSSPKIFASSKVSLHQERMDAYLRNERIYPITMELDLTQLCNRHCPECPYSESRGRGLTLQLPFLERLFSILGQHTPGIVLSGGEPTIVPHFPETVAIAKKKGFQEIAVISNGTSIHIKKVQEALLENVTSIRISMYDWQDGDSEAFLETLKNIRLLRDRVKKEASRLEIGAAMLTRKQWIDRIKPTALKVLDSGVDWLYFHPHCVDWETNRPVQADQSGVLEAIEDLKNVAPKGSNIQVPYERYSTAPLFFKRLHGAHFLIQVGADGVNYAGPECKYRQDYALLDLNEYVKEDFLWHPQRIERLEKMNSANYKCIGTKHRPPIFSDYVERLIQAKGAGKPTITPLKKDSFLYPEII